MNVKPEDRPKIIAVIVLFLLAFVVGAWRLKSVFAPPSPVTQKPPSPASPPPPGGTGGAPAPSPSAPPPTSETEGSKGPVVLVVRDPFTTTSPPQKVEAPSPVKKLGQPTRGQVQRPKKARTGKPKTLGGRLPPAVPGGNFTVRPSPTKPPLPAIETNLPTFILTGIIEGDIPVALLKKLGTEETSLMVREGEWIGNRRILVRSIQTDRIILQIGKTLRSVRVGESTTSPTPLPQATLHPNVSPPGSQANQPNPT